MSQEPSNGQPIAPASGLVYPFPEAPAPASTIEVAPGVHWIRMPLPFKLDHINLWALEDGGGWALVDTGLRTEPTVALWRQIFASVQDGRTLTRIFVTHMHPDHVGLAGWLTRKFSVAMWMTRLEYLSCRTTVSDTGREAPPDALRFYTSAGWPASALELYRARFGNYGTFIHAMPDSYVRLRDGQRLRIGAHEWEVVVGNGHSPEHACLYCPSLKLLISGDQVLPRISSNVSVFPMEPDADPMSDWLDSLAVLRARVPEDVLVLPAHNECFRGLHTRIDALADGQRRVLQRLKASLLQRRRVIDTFTTLFGRPIGFDNEELLGMATGEAIACLNYLRLRGEVKRELVDGVAWYQQM